MSGVPMQVQRAAAEADRLAQVQTQPSAPAPVAPESQPSEPPEDAAAKVRAELELANQRYRSLQGMVDDIRRRSEARVTELEEQVQKLAAAPQTPAAPPSYSTDDDVKEFGEETVNFVTRLATRIATDVAGKVAGDVMAARLAPVTQQVQDVAGRMHKSAQAEFYDTLRGAVPDWEAINVDPRFLNWLSQAEPVTGYPYQTLLTDAHSRLDAPRVIAIFDRFKGGANTPPATPARQAPVDERIAMIEPTRTASAPVRTGNAGKSTYSRASIARFYREVAAGRIPKEEAAATERDIILAQSEGRIVG